MSTTEKPQGPAASRRDFLKVSGGAVAAAGLVRAIETRAWAAGTEETIKVALVGCGGRGTGAAEQALSTKGTTQLAAMADVLPDRLEGSHKLLSGKFKEKATVPPDCRFIGMDAFKKAIDLIGPGGLVLLTTPPAFRPIHLEYAVEKGVNVFMEKSFAVDGPGIRRVLAAGKKASEKGVKIAGGLMSRHSKATEEVVAKIHGGEIGDVVTMWAYRMHGPVGLQGRRPGENELAHQIRNYSNFTWVNGSFLLDWLIHGLDICCWAKDAWPAGCHGHGGRQVRKDADQLYDHYAVEYRFPDGTRMSAQGRHMIKVWNHYICTIQGAKGTAVTGEGMSNPYILKGWKDEPANRTWEYKGGGSNAYQVEHDLLFDAIRNNKPYNETERCAFTALVGIMGRMAAESGQYVSWEDALNSKVELAPGLDKMTMQSDAPVMPDANGKYPLAMPGESKVY
jgi:predicted dehydrogenase